MLIHVSLLVLLEKQCSFRMSKFVNRLGPANSGPRVEFSSGSGPRPFNGIWALGNEVGLLLFIECLFYFFVFLSFGD